MSGEDEIFPSSRPDKTYASPAFKDYTGQKLRIANNTRTSRVIETVHTRIVLDFAQPPVGIVAKFSIR